MLQSLHRDDGLMQTEIGELLGRSVSWVSRRLKLLGELSEELLEQWRLGLLSSTEARELVRLPRGKQQALIEVAREHGLPTRQLGELVGRYLAAGPSAREELLVAPQSVLDEMAAAGGPSDPRLSAAGNRVRGCLQRVIASCEQLHRSCSPQALEALEPGDAVILEEPLARAQRAVSRGVSTLQAAAAARPGARA